MFMTDRTFSYRAEAAGAGIYAVAILVVLGVLPLAGCGSTKVYTTDKTVEYQGSIYNVSEVKQLSTRVVAEPSAGDEIDLTGYDSKRFDALVKEQGPMVVRTIIALDDRAVVYEQKQIEKGHDLSRMQKSLQSAYQELSRFMGDGKKTQLKLK
jgi:hypothetical protein